MLEFLNQYLIPLDNPASRLYWPNLIFALLILIAFSFADLRLFRETFRLRYWLNRSTRADYFYYLLNTLLKFALFIPLLDLSFFFASQTYDLLYFLFGDGPSLSKTYLLVGMATVLAFVWQDLLSFLSHFLMHNVKFLWAIHRVHHEARILTPVTVFRVHPLESALTILRNAFSMGSATGIFVYVFSSQISIWTFLGVNVFGLAFNFTVGNLRHSHVPLSFGFLEHLFISPVQHQIHHSVREEHHGKNFGVALAIWDRLFGTLLLSRGVGKLKFGVSGGVTRIYKRQINTLSRSLHQRCKQAFSLTVEYIRDSLAQQKKDLTF